MPLSYKLNDRVALITGSSWGIEQATVDLLARSGAKIAISGRKMADIESIKKRCIKATGHSSDLFLLIQGDINDSEYRTKVVDETVAKFGQLDILVVNVGAADVFQTFQDEPEEIFDKNVAAMKSTLFMIKEAAPHLEKTKGTVVVVSPPASLYTLRGQTSYCATGTAINHLVRNVALVLGPKHIRVNNIRPGFIATTMTEGWNASMFEDAKKNGVFGGNVNTAEDQSAIIGFLVSDSAGYVAGESVITDSASHLITPCFNNL